MNENKDIFDDLTDFLDDIDDEDLNDWVEEIGDEDC